MSPPAPLASPAVVAVSAAEPRWQSVFGRPLLTSIVRDASPHPIRFGPAGPEGNATAVHTEAVLAFGAEHYDHWTRELGVPREDWAWCRWGENLTLTGVDENDLRVGDALEVGDDARFVVTSPRIPCSKLAWRIGQAPSVLPRIAESGRTGFYLSVASPGMVGPGDAVRVRRTDASAITVADLSRLLAGPERADPARLRAVLANPALGDQARGLIAMRLTRIEDEARGAAGWAGWRPFRVASVAAESDDARSIELSPADGGPSPDFRAGQFLAVRLPGDDAAGPLIRSWSLSRAAGPGRPLRVTVRKVAGGRGSAWAHGAEPGAIVEARPPAGRFALDRGGFLRVVLISAGIGATPLLAMLQAHAARTDAAPPLLWIHAARRRREHVHADEAAAILRGKGFARHVCYSRPDPSDGIGIGCDEAGRLTPERLTRLLGATYVTAPFGRDVELEGAESDFYVCGPPSFEDMVCAALSAAGAAPERVRTERFAPRGVAPAPRLERAQIVFSASGVVAEWRAEDGLTLLELAEAHGLSPAFGCRAGLCGACAAPLEDGEVRHDPPPSVPPPPGTALACCARPTGALVRVAI